MYCKDNLKGYCSSCSKESINNLMQGKKEIKMTMDSHLHKSKGNHRDPIIVDIRKMNDEEFEKETIEIKA